MGEVSLVVGDAALGPVLDDEPLGVPEPDPLEGLSPGHSLTLLHRHGDQVGDTDGRL